MQEELFHEDLDAALAHVIASLGGNKRVGAALWPEESPDAAARRLADCMNPDRPQFLKGKQILWILCEARKQGVHSGMAFIARQSGYADPQPLEPEDEAAKLQREFIQAKEQFSKLLDRMERVNRFETKIKGVA